MPLSRGLGVSQCGKKKATPRRTFFLRSTVRKDRARTREESALSFENYWTEP
ncbi:unnamed protein product [Scytosiphon promiscuus]